MAVVIWFSCLATCPAVSVPIGAFDLWHEEWELGLGREFPGAQGFATLDGAEKKAGRGSLRVDADFAEGGGYINLSRRFAEGLPFRTLTGWICSDGVASLTLRAVDATGQTFQHRNAVPLTGSRRWEKVAIALDQFTSSEHWKGANDGVWHGPAKLISFSISTNGLAEGRKAGTVWFDDLAITLEAGAKPPLLPGAAKQISLETCDHGTGDWTFLPGSEFPGAAGNLASDPPAAKVGKGCLRLDADFSGGGSYVATHRNFNTTGLDIRELRFWLKHTGLSTIGLRLIDDSGQCHQLNGGLAVGPGEDWQIATVQTVDIVGGEHWGGANDGVWHPPLKGLSILIGAPAITGGTKASLWLDDIQGIAVQSR